MDARPGTLAAITAAGASSRMGEPKALLGWGEGTVLSTIVSTLGRAGFTEPLVILGAHHETIGAEAARVGAGTVLNEDWEDGRFTSIRIAATRARERSASLLLWPVDCPGVDEDTIRRLVESAEDHPDANIVPGFAGRGGHPVLLCATTVNLICEAPDEANLRDLLDSAPAGRIDMNVDDPAVVENINRPADYAAASRERAKGS